MSDENLQAAGEPTEPMQPTGAAEVSMPLPQGYELIINKRTNEIIIKDAAGHEVSLKATIIEEDDEEDEEILPLTPDEFRDGLQRIDALGLTWTADRIPRVKAKEASGEGALLSDEYFKIQDDYPHLPQELSLAVTYALTERAYLAEEAGGEEVLKKKAEIAGEIVISPEYRSEFFFKHALKVPYLSNIDWEVVFKLRERNVGRIPGVAYALLTLLFHDPNEEINKHKTTTIALDTVLVSKMIETLNDVKKALQHGHEVSVLLHSKSEKVESDANGEEKQVGDRRASGDPLPDR